jgi:hypothetical protein
VDEPFKSPHQFIAFVHHWRFAIKARDVPAPWQDTPIIALFRSDFNDDSMNFGRQFALITN